MVDDNPGTTVLPHTTKIKYKDIVINLVDVGGLKKKSKSHDKKQKLITKETLKNLKHSNIVLFLTEANSEFTKNDPVSEYHSDSASDIVCIKLLTVVFLEEFI